MLLSNDEKEDFERAVQEKGMDVDDFTLEEQEERPPTTTEVHAIVGEVTITRNSTSVVKKYRAGHGSSWVTDFADDLEAGAFG